MKYQNIIWDWNGTILNDVQLCVNIVNSIMDGHPAQTMSLEEYQDVFGFPVIDYYKRVGFEFEIESFNELATKFMHQYMNEIRRESLHIDAKEALQFFQKQKTTQYILSAAHKDDLQVLTQYFGVHSFFEEIEGLDNHKAASKVDVGKMLVSNYSFTKENTLMIGDTFHDYEVATAIGVDYILIAKGHQSRIQLVKHLDDDKVLNSLTELLLKIK